MTISIDRNAIPRSYRDYLEKMVLALIPTMRLGRCMN
jgi:hypothetical protein